MVLKNCVLFDGKIKCFSLKNKDSDNYTTQKKNPSQMELDTLIQKFNQNVNNAVK